MGKSDGLNDQACSYVWSFAVAESVSCVNLQGREEKNYIKNR